jgi:hypothetical protein
MSPGAIAAAGFALLVAMPESGPDFGESDQYHSFARWSTQPPG